MWESTTSLSINSQVSLLNLEKICPPHSKKAYPTQIEKGEIIYSLLEQKLEFSSIPRSPVRIHISNISNFFFPSNTYTRNRTLYRDPPPKKKKRSNLHLNPLAIISKSPQLYSCEPLWQDIILADSMTPSIY